MGERSLLLLKMPNRSRESNNIMKSGRVLVLDANQRSALAVTRSLGRSGVSVDTADYTPTSLAGESRFSQRYFKSPNVIEDPCEYLSWLSNILTANDYDGVFPVTEVTSQLLLRHYEEPDKIGLPFPPINRVMELADKGQLMRKAADLNLPFPETQWFDSSSDIDKSSLSYPLVIKPCLSKIFTGGCWISTRVKVIRSEKELMDELAVSDYLNHHPFMLQEFIPGSGAGVFCLYNQGKAITFFAHNRIREKPPEGGVSVLSESVKVDPLMKSYAVKLLDSVGWHGVAMVEFRVSDDGTPYLMEVNTRFWGSLQLAVDSGVDFPLWLWQIGANGFNGNVPENYQIGRRLRWLLGDLDSLYLVLKGRFPVGVKLKRFLTFFLPQGLKCRHEVNRWGDMGPAWYELRQYVKQLLGR